ncbi:hypothetical protein CWM22_00995 [Streptococcus suis]|nr:hypothetical protein CWM22_00995 [Streptococcus suis]
MASLVTSLFPPSLHHLFLLWSYPVFSDYHTGRMVEI